jgi:hypothetical protein
MAYNNKNFLKKVLEIQEIYLRYNARGHSGTWIYDNLIAPNYHISRRTLTNYLAINARKELREAATSKEFETSLHTARQKAEDATKGIFL